MYLAYICHYLCLCEPQISELWKNFLIWSEQHNINMLIACFSTCKFHTGHIHGLQFRAFHISCFTRVKLLIEEIEREEAALRDDLYSADRKFAEYYNVRAWAFITRTIFLADTDTCSTTPTLNRCVCAAVLTYEREREREFACVVYHALYFLFGSMFMMTCRYWKRLFSIRSWSRYLECLLNLLRIWSWIININMWVFIIW